MKWRLRPAQLLGSFGHAEEESNLLATASTAPLRIETCMCQPAYIIIIHHKNHRHQVGLEISTFFLLQKCAYY